MRQGCPGSAERSTEVSESQKRSRHGPRLLYNTTLRVAKQAQRQQALVDAVLTPELRKMMEGHGERMAEALRLQVKFRSIISPSLEGLMREQNQRIADMLDSAGIRRALAGIEFNLPDEWAEPLTAYREQIATEVAVEEEAEPIDEHREML